MNRQGNARYGNHLYWMSWLSDDPRLNTAEWDWFNARNYCRKRCMDLVSIETEDEYNWIKQQMLGKERERERTHLYHGGTQIGLNSLQGFFIANSCKIGAFFGKISGKYSLQSVPSLQGV